MNRIERNGEGPNIASVSLALYLLVSILSMMAAYEVGRVTDDVRNSVVVTLQPQSGPNKSGDDSRGDPVFILALETAPVFLRPVAERLLADPSHRSLILRSFNARAPPASSVPV